MTAAFRSTPGLSIPPTQNTAPVLEFKCLYTHDLRRKSKRWQDGFLRFHTFNKRVMVYDIPRNFIGDTHWKEQADIQEGDELTLDKGVMVEVAEAVGILETDLAPLFDKRSKDSPNGRPAARATAPPTARTDALGRPSQLRQKSLNALLGTPRGPYGKATIPVKSPFEARRDFENRGAGERSPKRQRVAEPQPERTVVRPPQTPRPGFNTEKPLRARTVDVRKAQIARAAPEPPKTASTVPSNHTAKEVVGGDSDQDSLFSDVTLPSPPPGFLKPPRPIPTSRPRETPNPARAALISGTAAAPIPIYTSSPPVSVSNKISHVGEPSGTTSNATLPPNGPSISPPRNPRAKALRLSKGRGRSTLLCQNTASNPSKSSTIAKRAPIENVEDDLFSSLDWDSLDAAAGGSNGMETSTTARAVQPAAKDPSLEFGAKISDHQPVGRNVKPFPAPAHEVLAAVAKSASESPPPRPITDSPSSSPDAFEEMAIVHGRMDQRLAVPKRTAPPKSTKSVNHKPKAPPKPVKTPRQSKPKTTRATPKSKLSDSSTASAAVLNPTKVAKARTPAKRARLQQPDPIDDAPTLAPVVPAKTTAIEASTHRPFRRVRSANDAPIPSTSLEWEAEDILSNVAPNANFNASTTNRPVPLIAKRKLQRSKSLAVGSVAKKFAIAMLQEPILPPAPPIDTDVGPWSTEACDLFDWRPPGWKDERGNGPEKGIGMLSD